MNRREGVVSTFTRDKTIAFKKLANLLDSGRPVLLDYIPADYSADLLVLPLKNNQHNPIRYIVPYNQVHRTVL